MGSTWFLVSATIVHIVHALSTRYGETQVLMSVAEDQGPVETKLTEIDTDTFRLTIHRFGQQLHRAMYKRQQNKIFATDLKILQLVRPKVRHEDEEAKYEYKDTTPEMFAIREAEENIFVDPLNVGAVRINKQEKGNHSVEGLLEEGKRIEHKNGRHFFLRIPSRVKPMSRTNFSKGKNWKFDARQNALTTANPELVIYVDNAMYTQNGGDSKSLIRYLTLFFHSINLRYDTMLDPKVKWYINGFVFMKSKPDQQWLENHRVPPSVNPTGIWTSDTLDEFGKFLKSNSPPGITYDVALLQTGEYLFNPGNPPPQLAGMGVVGGACNAHCYVDTNAMCDTSQVAPNSNDFQQNMASIAASMPGCIPKTPKKCADKIFSIAMAQDINGSYVGIQATAHELAHTLNAPEDESGAGDTDARFCPQADGYTMSYRFPGTANDHWFRFSPCTQRAMKAFFQTKKAACLQTFTSSRHEAFNTDLPGYNLTMDQQCQKYTGEPNTKEFIGGRSAQDRCRLLLCQRPGSTPNIIIIGGPAIFSSTPADGSPCGTDMVCKLGYCIPRNQA